jgi:hypothetical protein
MGVVVLSIINCTSDCQYQKDGICQMDYVTTASVTDAWNVPIT